MTYCQCYHRNSGYRRNSDANIRNLQRLASLSGDPRDYRAFLQARSRAGLCCNLTGWNAPLMVGLGPERCPCQMKPSLAAATSWRSPPRERIDELFPPELLEAQRDRWLRIGLATGPTDIELAQAGIRLAYETAGLPTEGLQFIWLPNPKEGAERAVELILNKKAGSQVWLQIKNQVDKQVWNQATNQVRHQVWNQVINQVYNQVGSQVWNQVFNQARNQQVCWGSHDASNLSFYDLFSYAGIRAADALRGLSWAAQATGWWWPFEKAVIVTERPTSITPTQIIYPGGWVVNR